MTDEPDVFATSVDLERRWHKLTDEEREKADTHLADVTDYIKERSPNWQRLLDERPRLLTRSPATSSAGSCRQTRTASPAASRR